MFSYGVISIFLLFVSAVEAEHAELAGTIMGCSLSIGLGLGALSSFLVTSFI